MTFAGQTQDSQTHIDERSAEPDVIVLDDDEDGDLELMEKANILNVSKTCLSVKDLLKSITLSPEDIAMVEQQTVNQSRSSLWKIARKGRITASNFYRVFTKVETLKKHPTTCTAALVNSLIDPPSLSHLPQISKGLQNEKEAVAKVIQVLIDSGHKNVAIRDCGLFIDSSEQFLGASPDGVIYCDCCEDMLLEVKCPSKDIDQLAYLDTRGHLKRKSAYYGQVQGQMMVTQIKKCLFYIHHDDDPKHQILNYDTAFGVQLRKNLCSFYEHYMAPTILQLSRKRQRVT